MANLHYETIEALVFDPVVANRSAMRAALSALGFRHVDCVSEPDDFSSAAHRRDPDIVFCEVAGDDTSICDRMQAIRLGNIGSNPFLVMIVTTWDKSEDTIKRVINAGADDVILRPFSNGILSARLEMLVERRKGFVITHDYVGPDRRRDPARLAQGLFEPPNTFAVKATSSLPSQRIETRLCRDIAAARAHLLTAKMRADAFQLGVLCRLLRETAFASEAFSTRCGRMIALSETLVARGRAAKTNAAGDLEMWGKEIATAARQLQSERNTKDTLQFLENAILNLYRIVDPAKPIDEYHGDLDRAIATIRARLVAGKPV